MAKQSKYHFEVSHEEEASSEMVLTAFTMLESRGYPGFVELLSVLGDPGIILKMVRLMYGMELKIPPLQEFIDVLQAAQYTFCMMHKKCNAAVAVSSTAVKDFMKIDDEREEELLKIFDEWSIYMNKNGHDVRQYFHINRNSTKKRIDAVTKGKKTKLR